MGRITIFTADDIHSRFVKTHLQKREIPYTEISLTAFPERRRDLKALASQLAIPSVFFNTRFIGGVKETVQILEKWDSSSRFATARERYAAEIGKSPSPSSPFFAEPPLESIPQELSYRHGDRPHSKTISLPNGNDVTVLDLTEKLRNSLPIGDCTYKKVVYTHAFTGEEAVKVFQKTMSLDTEEAVTFGRLLQDSSLMDHVCEFNYTAGQFRNSPNEVYRLQCYKHLNVLNSYRVWNEASHEKPLKVVSNLDQMLCTIELESMNKEGKVNYGNEMNHKDLPAFEEAVCELQAVSLTSFNEVEKMVFGINVFRLMIRYAFVKVGISTEDSLKGFFKSVQFNVGGNLFSFRDWIDGLLRCNKKSFFSKSVPFGPTDARRSLALDRWELRIHFALYAGAPYSSSCSLPFRQFTVEGIQEELEIAATIFCNDDAYLKIDTNTSQRKVELSPLLQWYQNDFAKNNEGVLRALREDVHVYRRQELDVCLADQRNLRLRYGGLGWHNNLDAFASYHPADTRSEIKGFSKIMRRWKPAVDPENERIRLTTLRRLNVLDTLREDRYDRITAELKRCFGVPIVFISLVDENRQWFKSTQWSCKFEQPSETGRDISFCGHAINNQEHDIFIVPNALEDERFAENPLVVEPPYIRFYAGYTLMVPAADGGPAVKIGTLCMIDLEPREMLTEEEMNKLRGLGRRVVVELMKQPGHFKGEGYPSFASSSQILSRRVAT